MSWWPGDGNVADIQGSNSGTLQNGATFAPGMVGQAFHFDGVDDYATIPSSPDLNPTSAITLEAWIKPNSVGDAQRGIVGTWDDISGNKRTYMLWITEFLISHSGGDYPRVPAPNPLQVNVWQHIAGTFDGTVMRLYLDGVLAGETVSSGPIATNDHPFFIGRTDSGSNDSDFFKGEIDELSLYNRALSLEEIQSIVNAGNAGKCPPFVGGSVTGISPTSGKVTCRNLTTKKTVKITIPNSVKSWDCEQAGLVVNPGDKIKQTITVTGPAN